MERTSPEERLIWKTKRFERGTKSKCREETFYFLASVVRAQSLPSSVFCSLCTDVPPPSEKIGRGDVCESPTIIVFLFPRNVGDSL